MPRPEREKKHSFRLVSSCTAEEENKLLGIVVYLLLGAYCTGNVPCVWCPIPVGQCQDSPAE